MVAELIQCEPRVRMLYLYSRIQQPRVEMDWPAYLAHLERMFERRQPHALDAVQYVASLFPIDALIVMGCLQNQPAAWESLFAARVGRADRLLIDALRQRASRLLPGNEEEQEMAVQDFWGHLLVPPALNSVPILQRYDGLRPLVPWLIRVFQNRIISQLRSPHHRLESLGEDDVLPEAQPASKTDARWHEVFRDAASEWVAALPESDLILLGLRWRYRLSQRDIANVYQVHEGTISRQIALMRDQCLAHLRKQMECAGWLGEDLQTFILQEMESVLLDEPRLSASSLARLLREQGKMPLTSSLSI